MKWLSVALALLLPLAAQAQTVLSISSQPTPEAVSAAKETIRKASDAPVTIPVGGYALAKVDFAKKIKCYVVPGSNDCLAQQPLPKGATYKGWLVASDEAVFKFREIKADPETDRYLIQGIEEGSSTLIWMANGSDEPVVVAAFKFIVGKGPEPVKPPPSPVEPKLTKDLRAAYEMDKVAGIGNPDHLEKLAAVYLALSNDSLASATTHAQLSEFIAKAVKAAGIPDYTKSLTNVRKRIQQEMLTRQGVTDDPASDNKPFDKAAVKSILKDIATSLDAINP